VILPEKNRKDVEVDLPRSIKDDLEIVFVKSIWEALNVAFQGLFEWQEDGGLLSLEWKDGPNRRDDVPVAKL
jgi:hypothetical protein